MRKATHKLIDAPWAARHKQPARRLETRAKGQQHAGGNEGRQSVQREQHAVTEARAFEDDRGKGGGAQAADRNRDV